MTGFENSDGYAWTVQGLGKYVFAKPVLGDGQVPEALGKALDAEVDKLLEAGPHPLLAGPLQRLARQGHRTLDPLQELGIHQHRRPDQGLRGLCGRCRHRLEGQQNISIVAPSSARTDAAAPPPCSGDF